MNQVLDSKLPYDPARDFAPIDLSQMTAEPMMSAANIRMERGDTPGAKRTWRSRA